MPQVRTGVHGPKKMGEGPHDRFFHCSVRYPSKAGCPKPLAVMKEMTLQKSRWMRGPEGRTSKLKPSPDLGFPVDLAGVGALHVRLSLTKPHKRMLVAPGKIREGLGINPKMICLPRPAVGAP